MTITKKPVKTNHNSKLINTIINKGGSSPTNQEYNINNYVKVTIRLPHKMLNMIDSYLEDSISKKTRTHWLREAAEEKIDRDITQKQNI
jgi:hypothetical protein